MSRLLYKAPFTVFSVLAFWSLFSLPTLADGSSFSNDGMINAFIHVATQLNSSKNWTMLDHHALNNQPGALVFVTPNWNPGNSGGTFNNSSIAVGYTNGKWSIVNQNGNTIPLNAAFNVYVLSHPTSDAFVQIATVQNSASNWTDIDNIATNNNPNALLLITPVINPTNGRNISNNHVVGVWYHNGRWSIFNQDRAPMPSGAAFNVLLLSSSYGQTFTHSANSANSTKYFTDLSNRLSNGHVDALVFVTAKLNTGNNTSGVYNNHPLGVWYHDNRWSILNQDQSVITKEMSFNVLTLRIRAV